MKVLVTGARGYIGTALVARLRLDGHGVRCFHRRDSANDGDIVGDLGDRQTWIRALDGIEGVVHLAAQTSVPVADADPLADHAANVVPMMRLLEACKQSHPRVVVFASTATVIGLPANLPVKDDVRPRPVTIYDVHKLIAEQYLEHYTRRGYVVGAALRLCNVYGPGPASSSSDRGVINQMVRLAAAGRALTIYGDGAQLRDYVFIDDVVDAFVRAIEHADQLAGEAYLIGTGVGHTFADAVSMVAAEATQRGQAIEVVRVPPPPNASPIDARNFVAAPERFAGRTGWQPSVALRDGILRAFDALGHHG